MNFFNSEHCSTQAGSSEPSRDAAYKKSRGGGVGGWKKSSIHQSAVNKSPVLYLWLYAIVSVPDSHSSQIFAKIKVEFRDGGIPQNIPYSPFGTHVFLKSNKEQSLVKTNTKKTERIQFILTNF